MSPRRAGRELRPRRLARAGAARLDVRLGAVAGTVQGARQRRVLQAAGREGRHRGLARHRFRRIRRRLCAHRAGRERAAHPPGRAQRPPLPGKRARAIAQRRPARHPALIFQHGSIAVMAQPLKLGVAGLGNVGAALVAQLAREREQLAARCGRAIEVVAVCARNKGKDRGLDLKKMKWFADPVALARDPGIDVFVELIGGAGDPARAAVKAALAAGKSVVTANKALLAKQGVQLAMLAEKNGVALNFEAAAAAAIPIVKTLREGLAGNRVARIYGILNGTCNYILTKM